MTSTVASDCIALLSLLVLITFEYRLVVSVHKTLHLFSTAVAHSHGVAVEKGVKFVVSRKVFVYQKEKVACNISFYCFLKGGLYQITLRLRCLFRLVLMLEGCSYFKVALKLLSLNALL